MTQSETTIELQPWQHLHPLAHYYQNIDVNQTSNQILFKTALFLLFLVSRQNLFHSIHCSEPFRMSMDAGNWMQLLTVLCFSSEKVEDQEKTRPVYSSLSNYVTGRTLNSKVTCSFQLWPPSRYSLGHSLKPPPRQKSLEDSKQLFLQNTLKKQISEDEACWTGRCCAGGNRRDGVNTLPKAGASETGKMPAHAVQRKEPAVKRIKSRYRPYTQTC